MNLTDRIEEIKSDEKRARLKSKLYLAGAFGGAVATVSSAFYGVMSPESFYDNLLFSGSALIAGGILEGLCLLGCDFNKNRSKYLREEYRLIFKDKT